jgi:hypothetical protein
VRLLSRYTGSAKTGGEAGREEREAGRQGGMERKAGREGGDGDSHPNAMPHRMF